MTHNKSVRLKAAFRRCILGLIAVVSFTPQTPYAQTANLAVGYTSMRGRIGEFNSDRGFAVRLGVDVIGRSHFAWNVEAGIDRLNAHGQQNTTECYNVGRCHFDYRSRDTGLSLGTVLRAYPGSTDVRPYGLIGVGFLRVKTHQEQSAVDDAGNPLPSFNFDFTATDDAIQVHIGAGVQTTPGRLPVGIYIEGRATRLFYGYSGGFAWSWNPTLVAGIRTGRRS